jgi:hypothetical protein
MAYYDIALLAGDGDFLNRVAAAYATETVSDLDAENPMSWASFHAWLMAAQPGFGDAYAYALANGNPAPGKDDTVITDEQILSAVQSILIP